MRHDAPDFRHRSPLTELMDEPCSREVLRACLRDIALTNRWTFAYRPVLHWLNAITASQPPLVVPLRILDVGCGYGDVLRRIERWADARRVAVELVGLDLNPDATAIAARPAPPTAGFSGSLRTYSTMSLRRAAASGLLFTLHAPS